jgi:hypothetical protein
MACVYKHLRKDTNEVFYIGIGKNINRAFSKLKRNKFWYELTDKNEYHIEIIEDNLTWDEACEREKYWIKFYGRRDLNQGTLINMTDGGNGTINHIFSAEHKEKIKKALKGREFTYEHKNKLSEIGKIKYKNGMIDSLNWKGRKHTEESKIKISGNHADVSGINNPFFGKYHSELSKEKMRKPKSKVKCPHCELLGGISNMKRYHFENCKQIKDKQNGKA